MSSMSREKWYAEMLLSTGEQLATHLGWPQDRGRNLSLAWAFLSLRMKHRPGDVVSVKRRLVRGEATHSPSRLVPVNFFMHRLSLDELMMIRREYSQNTGDPLPISDEYYRKAYDRVRYFRGLEAERRQTEQEWSSELTERVLEERDVMYAQLAGEEHHDPCEELIDELGLRLLLEKLAHYLPPAEAAGLESLLSGEPTKDAADRKRRSRARASVTELLLPFLKGELMNEPTLAETVTDLDERLRDVERHVGLPEGGRRAVTVAVERFLDSLEEPPSK